MDIEPEALATLFHETYERLAPEYGYKTRPETRELDFYSPNGRLMVATCMEVIRALQRYERICPHCGIRSCDPSPDAVEPDF